MKRNKQLLITAFVVLITLIILVLFLYFFKNNFGSSEVIGNLHTHTTCSDGTESYDSMIEEALRLKMDFIAITDHRYCEETYKNCIAETRLLCIYGQEINVRTYENNVQKDMHVLALDIPPGNTTELFPEIFSDLQVINVRNNIVASDPTIVVKKIHELGGFAIAAHPLYSMFHISEYYLNSSGFDAMECFKDEYPDIVSEQKLVLSREDLPCMYSSDAHKVNELKRTYSRCVIAVNVEASGSKLKFDAIKKAILEGNCKRYE